MDKINVLFHSKNPNFEKKVMNGQEADKIIQHSLDGFNSLLAAAALALVIYLIFKIVFRKKK